MLTMVSVGNRGLRAEVSNAPPAEKRFRIIKRLLGFQTFMWPSRALSVDGILYVLEAHRGILVSKDGDTISRSITEGIRGGTDMAVDGNGRLYVNDYGARRVQIFEQAGKRVGGFTFEDDGKTIAVTRTGTVVLNQPTKGSLLTAYSPDGVLLRSFGLLKRVSDGEPPADVDHAQFARGINRVHMAAGDAESVYVSFDLLPIVQKYELSTGRLLWEKRLASKAIAAIQDQSWHPHRVVKNPLMMVINGFFPILNGIAADPSTGTAYILSNDARILVLDRSGTWVGAYLDERVGDPASEGPSVHMSISFSSGHLYTNSTKTFYEVGLNEPTQERRERTK